MEKRAFDLFELVRILLKNRAFILVFVGIVAIGAVIYSLVTPQIWSSQASFYAVGESGSSLPIDLPGLSGITSSFFGTGGGGDSKNFITVMNSRTFGEDVIRKFDLIKYFKLSQPDSLARMDKALEKLRENMVSLGLDDNTGLIRVSVESKSKSLSRGIAEYYVEKLELYNREQKITKGKMNREFLEARVTETKAELDSLILAVRDFQARNRAVALEAQSTALIEAYSRIIAEKMSLDIEYELARQNYASGSPVLSGMETRRSELSRQIREMELGSDGLKPRYLIDIASLPDLSSQYAQLKLNLEIKSKVFEYLYPQYEAARLDELKDMPTLEILDSPREAGIRVRPRRAIICVVATLIAFIFASLIVLIKTVLENNRDRLTEIRDSFKK
ncbi:MAG: Wzz/FepE/Etk N-terminal domain-containing protein [Candidatus Cloacimonadota bacterium]